MVDVSSVLVVDSKNLQEPYKIESLWTVSETTCLPGMPKYLFLALGIPVFSDLWRRN